MAMVDEKPDYSCIPRGVLNVFAVIECVIWMLFLSAGVCFIAGFVKQNPGFELLGVACFAMGAMTHTISLQIWIKNYWPRLRRGQHRDALED